MMTWRAVSANLCAAVLIAACGSVISSMTNASEPRLLKGQISAQSVHVLIRTWPEDAHRLIITSQGGEIEPAIALGRFLVEREIEVVVRDYCLSACAHFVFAPASRKEVEPYALIGFHGTATARERLLANSGRPELAEKYAALARKERDFYDDVGISGSLLVHPLRQIMPICYIPQESQPAQIVTRVHFFIPSRETLIAQQVRNVVGFWPQSQEDITAIARRIPPTVHATLKFEGSGEGEQEGHLQGVPVCPASLVLP